MKKENRIAFRVTDQEKKRIAVLAKKCGLSVSEYYIIYYLFSFHPFSESLICRLFQAVFFLQ